MATVLSTVLFLNAFVEIPVTLQVIPSTFTVSGILTDAFLDTGFVNSTLNPPYIVKSFFLENQVFFSVSSINISEEGAIEMDIFLYLVRK